jgi:archaellum biogenesis ATPase FlaH
MNSDIRMVEVATGHVSNRHQAVLLENLNDYIFKKEDRTETYHSWYLFDEQLGQHIKATGSIQGFNGVYYINKIILDFDKKNLTDDGLLGAVRFLVNTEMIDDLSIDEDHILIWYSGTGFHIEIPDLFGFTPSTTLPSTVKETLTSLFPECDSIYDGARIIRANYSYNQKLGNFKVPFNVEMLNKFSMEEIKESSANCSNDEIREKVDVIYKLWSNIEPYLGEYIKQPSYDNKAPTTVRTEFKIDPNSVVTCMQTVLGQTPPAGERNETMMRIASWMRRNGMPEKVVRSTLSDWSGLPDEAKRCSQRVFDEKYEYSCSDFIMSKYCKPNCIHFKHKDYNLNILNPSDMEEKYEEFMMKDFTDMAFNFADLYDIDCDFWVYPGELVIVTGNTGLGKSTWVMNLVARLNNMSCLFLSLENSFHLTFRRFVQMTASLSKTDVMSAYQKPAQGVLNLEGKKKPEYYKAFKHINILCESPELKKLQETIARMQPRIVVVDTTDMVWVKGVQDELSKMNDIINGLKSTAQSQECIIIAVHHINKQAMHDGITTITSLKGSTNVVQKADKVLAINGENNDNLRSLHSEKARDDGNIKIMFDFNKRDMTFNQKTDSEGFVVPKKIESAV